MEFNEQNWAECLRSLNFTEQKNNMGFKCYNVYDNTGYPRWEYDTERRKERLYYFFSGMLYAKNMMIESFFK